MNWIFVLLFCELLLFLFAFYISGQDIMAPSVVMCAMFLLSTCFAIYANVQLNMTYGFESCIILVSGLTTFVLSEALFRKIFQKKPHNLYTREMVYKQKNYSKKVTVQTWVIVALLIYDMIILLWSYREIGHITGAVGIKAFGLYRGMNNSTVALSNDYRLVNVWLSQFQKIVSISAYISAYLLSQNLIEKDKKLFENICLILLMVLSQAMEVLSGARTGILRLCSAYLIMYYILWHQKYGWHRNLSWKYIKIGLLCVVIGAPIFYYIVPLLGRTQAAGFIDYITIYIGNPIWLFDLYVKNPVPLNGFGEESLCGINSFLMRYFGMNTYVRNNNLEFRRDSGVNGNIYTFFRRPLHDFGFGGMLIFTVLVALLFSWIYYSKIKWRPRSKKTDSWTLIYGFLFYWIVVSSMVQFSFSYLNPGSILNMVLMVIGYRFIVGVKFVWKDRKVRTPLKSSMAVKG